MKSSRKKIFYGRKARATSADPENLANKIPVKNAEWVEKDGHVAIVAERFRGRIGKKVCELIGRNKNLYIRLNKQDGTPDEVSKLTWKLIDGNLTVGEIQEVLEMRFPGKKLDVRQLAVFLRILENNNWITYRR